MLTVQNTDTNVGFTYFSSFSEISATSPFCWEISILTPARTKQDQVCKQARAYTHRLLLLESVSLTRKFGLNAGLFPRHFVPAYQRGRCCDVYHKVVQSDKQIFITVGGTRVKCSQWTARTKVLLGITTFPVLEMSSFSRSRQSYWTKRGIIEK